MDNKADKWVEELTNELVKELVDKYGFKTSGECQSITIWIFDEKDIEISQNNEEGPGFNRVKCNFNKEVSINGK